MSELTEAIRAKGYWHIDVRPNDYVADRVPYPALGSLLDRSVVQLRGWDFPHIDRRGRDQRGNTWIGGETDWDQYKEAWRFYQSGQFVYQLGIHEDWIDGTYPPNRLPEGVVGIGVGDMLFRITETYEFASLLSFTEAGGEQMRIAIDIRNIAGRPLYVDSYRMPMDRDRSFSEPILRSAVTVSRADLAGRSRELAIDAASEVFARFGWHPTRALLQEQQSELRWP
jgi:hypothetical protein